jgi:transposase-like protein
MNRRTTTMATVNLADLMRQYGDEDKARAFLESLRWPNGPICPRCGSVEGAYRLTPKPESKTRKGLLKCRACRCQFTVTVGTVFEDSHIPLSKWVIAIHLLCASKKGMSAHQLHRMLGISYKAAWFMAHRIRYAMAPSQDDKLGGVVEVDETYIGGKVSNRLSKMGTGRGTVNKIPVVSLLERGGRVRSVPMPKITADNLHALVKKNVRRTATIVTDEYPGYKGLDRKFAGHQTVKHSEHEYVRGSVHVNTVEGFFGILKRGINGVYHHVGQGHLWRYLDEFDYRYNLSAARGVDDGERAAQLVRQVAGKRLLFKPSSAVAGA